MTQFNVSVIGSLQNGYTATAEKIANSVSNAPVEVKSATMKVEAQPLAPATPELLQANLKKEMDSQKLRRGAILSMVNIAKDTAQIAVIKMHDMLKEVRISTDKNNKADNTSKNSKTAIDAAVTAAIAAVNAIKNADEALKAGFVNNETKTLMEDALNISKTADVEVTNAIDTLSKIKTGTTLTRNMQSPVIVAKKATEKALNIWTRIYNRMDGMLKGGRYTQRKRKHHKRYTARK